MTKNARKNILALFFGCILGFSVLEGVIRIFDPLPSRVKGDQIVLKSNLTKKIKIQPAVAGLDSVVTHRVNSLGFRGEDPPEILSDFYSILTVGGSTTECSLISEGKTWTDILGKELNNKYGNIWINNAGMDGMSTYGHLILLQDYLIDLRPDMILFLVGMNERAKASFENETGFLQNRAESWLKTLLKKSELLLLLDNVRLSLRAKSVNLGHGSRLQYGNIEDVEIDDDLQQELNKHKTYLVKYRKRLEALVSQTTINHIQPVLITQPIRSPRNSRSTRIMELYNNVTREVADANDVQLIDLAFELEDTDDNYYDSMHYSNKGAETVASIIFKNLEINPTSS